MKMTTTGMDFEGFIEAIQGTMEIFRGEVAMPLDENIIRFQDADGPEINLSQIEAGKSFFVLFTGPDTEGGMVYGDGSPVTFDVDNDDNNFGSYDFYGFKIERAASSWIIESARCEAIMTGPCCCHFSQAVIEVPQSTELIHKMRKAISPYILNDKIS